MTERSLVERDLELAVLRSHVEKAAAGGSGFLALTAPAGLGKTQLLRETRGFAHAHRLRVLSANGTHLERMNGLGVVRQLFDPLFTSTEPEQRSRWLSGAGRPAGRAMGWEATGDAQSEFAVLHGLFWFTANLCHDQPVLLLIDDLHWADEPSLRYLLYLLPRLEGLGLSIVAGLRPHDPAAPAQLIDALLTDPECALVRPAPLTADGTSRLLAAGFGSCPAPEFTETCQRTTGGNPLLLRELVHALVSENQPPTAASVALVERIGSRALARRVTTELARLGSTRHKLAEAVAILGSQARLTAVASLTSMSVDSASTGLRDLQDARLLEPSELDTGVFEFVHPLVRTAVYDNMDLVSRTSGHALAAELLDRIGARPALTAAHLLHTVPSGNANTVATLRSAAAEAVSRGTPGPALEYLVRALHEPPSAADRFALLVDIAQAAVRVDYAAAVEYGRAAISNAPDNQVRARLIADLGSMLAVGGNVSKVVEMIIDCIDDPCVDEETTRRLEANVLGLGMSFPGIDLDDDRVMRILARRQEGTIGAKILDCVTALWRLYAGLPIDHARLREALADPNVRTAGSSGAFNVILGCYVLAVTESDEGVSAFDAVIREARSAGSTVALAVCHVYRGLGWLRRGDLAEANADLDHAIRLSPVTNLQDIQPVMYSILAEIRLEQGRIDEAAEAIHQAKGQDGGAFGEFYYTPYVNARVLLAQGEHLRAAVAARAAGNEFSARHGSNPGVVPWRSTMAMALHMLGRHTEAKDLVDEELALARSAGGRHAIGHALRIRGLVTPDQAAAFLEDAVRELKDSPSRLEYAHALTDYGAELNRGGDSRRARGILSEALDIADKAGAKPLVERAAAELRAAGARPRRNAISGAGSLTPSEQRVAELASRGQTNREIAQQLFVTTKTVEIHLSSVYRKLGATGRRQLNKLLSAGD